MKLLAQQLGNIDNPYNVLTPGVTSYTGSSQGSGLIILIGNLIKLSIVIAALYTFLNFILAGYAFLSAGGEPKNIAKAWEKIWQSVIGLLVVAGAVLLAGIFGLLIFGNSSILLSPRIFTP